jgi:acetyl-CoA carboxylase beta subunit
MSQRGSPMIFDPGSVASFAEDIVSGDPIGWPGYPDLIATARTISGSPQAVAVGTARVQGTPCVFIHFDFAFAGGSLGQAEGSRIAAAFEHAVNNRMPLVSIVASGGARMQEGTAALTQMQRIAACVAAARRVGVPHITVLRDPTTGGVWTSLAAVADVIVAAPRARVSFAGQRTMPHGNDGHHDAFHSQGKWERGFVDVVCDDQALPDVVAALIEMLSPATRGALGAPPPPPHVPAWTSAAPEHGGTGFLGWDQVLRARALGRPGARTYLAEYFDSVFEIRGDRTGGVDETVQCGFGRSGQSTTAFIAQTGGRTAPAGFRTAARLLSLAERFRLPVLTLVDTPGAMADVTAEDAGVGTAIGELLVSLAGATVPITSVVIGEGGSGGALALLAPGRTWMSEDSYLAVTAPELATAILKQRPEDVAQVADRLRLTPRDQEALGISRGVLRREKEGAGAPPAGRDPGGASGLVTGAA